MNVLHWIVRRYQATVIDRVYIKVLFFTAWATGITLISRFVHNLGISNQILTVLGIVLGLVVSFRTSSAYERYQEGRRLWTSIQLHSRNLATLIWVHVPNDRRKPCEGEDITGNGKPDQGDILESIIEKRSMIHLIQAFSVAVKHSLRGEHGVNYPDLHDLIAFLPLYNFPDDDAEGSQARKQYGKQERLPPPTLPRKHTAISVHDALPFGSIFKPLFARFGRREDKPEQRTQEHNRTPAEQTSNLPLEINLFLNSYFSDLLQQDVLKPAICTGFFNTLGALQDSLANCERVRTSPLPIGYKAHLRLCMEIYLLVLPFQLLPAYTWLTIPATAFASFLLLGFLEIGQEVEDPFGYEANDLNLDQICDSIARELYQICSHPAPDARTYIFTEENRPFLPDNKLSARTLVSDETTVYHDADNGHEAIFDTLRANQRAIVRKLRAKYGGKKSHGGLGA
ncbi:hypothetical protein AURDEDRAFT_186965 [Auricularia subglabra TFB-10046 SS5]|nr:hypothetical protein AURDEDRAFT_186965 [Auricularia subglabra TFB-10046 SS5]